MRRLYRLTPLGHGWGWGCRLLEVGGQTLALVIVEPILLVHRGTTWVRERILP